MKFGCSQCSMGSLVSSCLSGGNPMLMFSGSPSGSLCVNGLCTLHQPYAFQSDSLFMLTCCRAPWLFQLQVSAQIRSGFGFLIAGRPFALGVTGLAVCLWIDSRWFVDFSQINCAFLVVYLQINAEFLEFNMA